MGQSEFTRLSEIRMMFRNKHLISDADIEFLLEIVDRVEEEGHLIALDICGDAFSDGFDDGIRQEKRSRRMVLANNIDYIVERARLSIKDLIEYADLADLPNKISDEIRDF